MKNQTTQFERFTRAVALAGFWFLLSAVGFSARAQMGTYVVPRVTTLYSGVLTNGQTITNAFMGTNFLNYSGFHQPGLWVTIVSSNTLQAPNGAGNSTNAVAQLSLDFSPGTGSGYTNSLLGTNWVFSTGTPWVWTITLNGNPNGGGVYVNQVTYTNLPQNLVDSIQNWRGTRVSTTATNPTGFSLQIDQVIAP